MMMNESISRFYPYLFSLLRSTEYLREAEAERAKELHAALVIQKVARGFLTRRRLDSFRYAAVETPLQNVSGTSEL
jgi:hypothetical protein